MPTRSQQPGEGRAGSPNKVRRTTHPGGPTVKSGGGGTKTKLPERRTLGASARKIPRLSAIMKVIQGKVRRTKYKPRVGTRGVKRRGA